MMLQTDQYFYHSDHLGSASFISDASGNPVQHLQYLPFGESFIDQRTSSFSSRYTFSAKEKDDVIERSEDSRTPVKNKKSCEQTGYSYFGARYYDSVPIAIGIRVWLSVDPLAGKYPSMSPFMYCAGNPILFKDPDGRILEIFFKGKHSSTAAIIFTWFVNLTLEGEYEITYSAGTNGGNNIDLIATKNGGNYNAMSDRAQAFYTGLKSIIDSKKVTTKINVVWASNDVHTGNYETGEVDIVDILSWRNSEQKNGNGALAMGKLLHEFSEQRSKASHGGTYDYVKDHGIGCLWEGTLNNNTREDMGTQRTISRQKFTNNENGEVTNVTIDSSGPVIKAKQETKN